jgi:hypothetical protein
MVAGHLSFSPFMLLPLAAACLLGPSRPDSLVASWTLRCTSFALLLAAMLEGGMLILIPPVYLSLAMVVALYAVVAREPLAMLVRRLVAGTLLGLVLCAGKLAAVLSLMANIPRDAYKLPGYLSLAETFWVAQRALFIGPGDTMQTRLANASVLFQRHEFEYTIGPAALALLLGFAFLAWRQRAWPAKPQRLAMDALLLLLLIPLALNTYGAVWTPFLKTLPILRNSSSLLRWFAAYILPATLAAGLSLDRLATAWRLPAFPVAVAAGSITLAALLLSDHSAYGPTDIGGYDPSPIDAAWRSAAATGQVPPVTEIGVLRDPAGQIDKGSLTRQDSMAQGQSQLFCYDALFGYRLENFPQGALHPGSVFEQTAATTQGGPRLNLKNPACYVFPGANACRPGDAFRATEIDQATRFVSYKPFTWRKPFWAHAADWAGYIFWPATILALCTALLTRIFGRRPRPA